MTNSNFNNLIQAASSKDKVQVKLKNEAKAELVVLLSQLCDYVNTTTNNPAELEMSGFHLNKIPEPISLKAPHSLKLTDGKNSGELMLRFPVVKAPAVTYFK